MKRRTFNKLLISTGTAIYGAVIGVQYSLAEEKSPDPGDTLRAYFHTLIPADAESPGAIELRIPEQLYLQALQSPFQRRIYHQARRWLDKEAIKKDAQSFSALHSHLQEAIVSKMENAEEPALEKYFFDTTLQEAMRIYYSHPEVIRQMAYAHAPQPMGFPDFQHPPKQAR